MGMDVYGEQPIDKTGEYFRNNVWWWRPLADYCCTVAPEITARCQYWQSNDGDGLNHEDAIKLADVLDVEIASGRTEAYAAQRAAVLTALPDEVCYLCAGTGKRKDPPAIGAGTYPCNGCAETGRVRPNDTHYPFTVENVQRWIQFLRTCGGFRIS